MSVGKDTLSKSVKKMVRARVFSRIEKTNSKKMDGPECIGEVKVTDLPDTNEIQFQVTVEDSTRRMVRKTYRIGIREVNNP